MATRTLSRQGWTCECQALKRGNREGGLIEELLDEMHEAMYFSKIGLRIGITRLGWMYFELFVCTLLTNAHATSVCHKCDSAGMRDFVFVLWLHSCIHSCLYTLFIYSLIAFFIF